MEWKTSWSYLPINYNTIIGTVENITQRTFIKNNLNGKKIKVKFSNLYSKESLILEKVVVGQKKSKNNDIEDSIYITYKGNKRIVIGAGEEFYSDELEWNIKYDAEIVISMYLKEKANIQSACSTWRAKSWKTGYVLNGDYTMEQNVEYVKSEDIYPYVKAEVNKANIIFGISEVNVFTDEKVTTIALFGDSITHMSYYSDELIDLAYKKYPGKVTIINRGIGGNRLIHDATFVDMPGKGKCFGEAGIKRFKKDIYSNYPPEVIIILEGVNDMMHPYLFNHPNEVVSVDVLKEGIKRLIETAHKMESKVYLGTVMPFRNDKQEFLMESEKVRVEYNEWIINQRISEGVIDFSSVISDYKNLEYMKKGTHIGDGLHPNEKGGQEMAKLIPMEWLK